MSLIQINGANLDNALIGSRKYRLSFWPFDKAGQEPSKMSVIVLGAIIALAVLVMSLAGSQFARRILILMVGLTAATLVAVWFVLRPV
jgi:hypothetical protein